jgi:peptide deformylase
VRLMVYNPAGERGSGKEYVLVNPRIVKFGKTRDLFDEGCLSFPVIERGPDQAPTIEAEVEVSDNFFSTCSWTSANSGHNFGLL